MNIIRTGDYQEMSQRAARIIAAQIILKPDCVLGLATGATPLKIYHLLIAWHESGVLDFRNVKTFNLDEYKGLSRDNSQSYSYYMHENLFDYVNIDPENTSLPDGTSVDSEKECMNYENKIRLAGGIDLQLLGIGHNGHIGFNEPGNSFVPKTHCVNLQKRTIEANSRFFASSEEVPKQAYTMGIKTIMMAKKILLVVKGRDKAEILKRAITGPVAPEVPASILQLHPNVTLIADKDAMEYL
ncbi:MAG: glucosamine-6-phosphate deaminase [Clostridiales bacterium]|nr:glucosamine-6-phosphate deaminase [Clostridiales bacterium]